MTAATASSFTTAAGALTLTGAAASTWSTGAGALTLDGAGGVSIVGNSSEVDITTTGALDMNAAATTIDSSAGVAVTAATASSFTTSGGALTLTAAAASTWSTGAGALTLNGAGGVNIQEGGSNIIAISDSRGLSTTNTSTMDLDCSGALQLNSSGGAISIGNDDVDQSINIGTAGDRTITIGNNGNGSVTLHGASFSGETSLGGGSIIVVEAGSTIASSADAKFADTAAVSNSADLMYNTRDLFTMASRNIMNLDARGLSTADGTVSGTGTMNIKSGSGGMALTSTGTGDITLDSDDTMLLDADGVLELNSSGGAISIGNDAVAQAINLGTGAAARTITMGNVTGATALVLNSGTGGVALASTGSGDITLNSTDTMLLDAAGVLQLNSSAGAISIGNDDVSQGINIGTDGTRTITVGASSGQQSLNVASHDGSTYGLKLAGTLVTSSAAELNELDGFRTSTGDVQAQLDKLQQQIDDHAGAPNAFWVSSTLNSTNHIAFASSDYTHYYSSIQAAMDAAKQNPRGISADPVIYVLAGSYTTNSGNVGVTIPATYTAGSGQSGYESGDVFNCSIVGIDPEGKAEINLDFANSATGQTDVGISITNGSSNVTIKNLMITNCFQGIKCSTSYTGKLRVENVTFTKCGWNGTAAGSETAAAYDTMYHNDGGTSHAVDDGGALRIESSGKCEIFDCDVENCNNGLLVVSDNAVIRDNRVKTTLGIGVRLLSSKNSEITGNIIDGSKNNGVRLEHCYDCFVKSNTILNTYNAPIACFYNVNDQILNNVCSECNQKDFNGAGGASADATANQQVYAHGQVYVAGSVVSQTSSDGVTSGVTYAYTVKASGGVSGLTSQADLFNKSQATIAGNVFKNCHAGKLQTIDSNAGTTVAVYLNSDVELGCLVVNNTAQNPLAYSTDYDVGGSPVDNSAANAYLVVSNHGANSPAVLVNNNVGHGFTALIYDAAQATSSAAQLGMNMLLTNSYTEQNLPTVG